MSEADIRIPIKADAPAGLIQTLDAILVHNDGACYSPVEYGTSSGTDDRGYPRLSTAPVKVRFVKLGTTPIANGDSVAIATTEPLAVALGKTILGAWNTPALYYWQDDDTEKQLWTIYRTAGAGTVSYGDEIYLVNVNWQQRLGRQEGKIYLTTDEDFTDTFTLVNPSAPPLVTAWNPLDQIHRAGEQKQTPAHGWVWRKTDPGQEMLSVETSVPAASYFAVVQLAAGGDVGKDCVRISVQSGGAEIASKTVTKQDYPANDWQRAMVPFTTTSDGVVKIVVTAADNDETLWTGAVSISPAGQRPFYVIAHRCNTVDEAYAAWQKGANAIELDITPVQDGNTFTLTVHHTGGPTTPLKDYLEGIVANGVASSVALLQFDIKPEDWINNYDYGFNLASAALTYGITMQRAFFSVEDPAAANDFYRGVQDADMFNGARDASLIKSLPNLETDPSIWYDVATTQAGATFLGIGVDSKVIISTMADWLEPFSYLTVMRDREQIVKKAYYWTLDSNDSMRKILDLNADGIIVNDPSTLLAVLQEQPYVQMFRLATVNDAVNSVYGWSVLAEPRPPRRAAPRVEMRA